MRRARVELLGLLTVLLFTPILYAQRVSLEELADSDGTVRKTLGEISASTFHETLDLLAREQGITPRSDAVVSAAEQVGEVLITELDDPHDGAKRLFLFFLPAKDEASFLQIRLGADATPEMRLWAEGPSEIVIAGDDVRLLPVPSAATFRLSRPMGRDKLSASDTIDCISATSTITLVLIACNCVSVSQRQIREVLHLLPELHDDGHHRPFELCGPVPLPSAGFRNRRCGPRERQQQRTRKRLADHQGPGAWKLHDRGHDLLQRPDRRVPTFLGRAVAANASEHTGAPAGPWTRCAEVQKRPEG